MKRVLNSHFKEVSHFLHSMLNHTIRFRLLYIINFIHNEIHYFTFKRFQFIFYRFIRRLRKIDSITIKGDNNLSPNTTFWARTILWINLLTRVGGIRKSGPLGIRLSHTTGTYTPVKFYTADSNHSKTYIYIHTIISHTTAKKFVNVREREHSKHRSKVTNTSV